MLLAGDTGGTKTVLALCDETGRVVRDQLFVGAEFQSLEAIVTKFLTPDEKKQIRGACFGIAGPVIGGVAKLTNLPWVIAASALSTELGGVPVTLLNDLQATALGSLVVTADKFAVLQPGGTVAPDAPIAVIAPGTGLGEALLVSDGKRYRALASEGGHADFAPGTDEEIELLRFLREKYGWHVSYERVLSGNGLGDLYSFARTRSGTAEPAWLTEQIKSGDRNAAVAQAGLANKDAACAHALELFAEILGAEAGNLALRGLATGGVVIGGGIPPKILPALQTGALMKRFTAKGRFEAWCKTIPVRISLEPRAALLGAAHFAATYKDAT